MPAVVVVSAGLFSSRPAYADVCVYKPPTVKRICGVVVDPSGAPIPNATVSVLKGGVTISTAVTRDDGAFDFSNIEAGEYGLEGTLPGFQSARYRLMLREPSKSCREALRIEMAVGGIHCGGDIRLTKKPLAPSR